MNTINCLRPADRISVTTILFSTCLKSLLPFPVIMLLVTAWCWLVPREAVCAAMSPIPDENIHISADRMGQTSADEVYTAEGHVVVVSQGMNLVADRARYSAMTHILQATGSVVLTKGTTILKGETLVLDMDSGRAEMDKTQLTMPESGMTLTSDKLVRLNESQFTASSSELTSCDLPDPSWKFGSEVLKVNLLGYATGRDVIFYIHDVPVLYLPWIAFPVVLEKRSGLLFPHFGYSKSRGAQLEIPLYLVISPSQDLQLDVDLLSRRGVGTGLGYRYIRARGSEGHMDSYQIYDQVEERWRWQLSGEHKEIFSPDANLRLSVNAISDRTVFKDYSELSGDYNRQSTDTTVNVLKTWQNFSVNSYMRYSENLYAANNQTTLQTLPSIGLAGVRQPLFSQPLYFDIDGSVDNFYRESAAIGQRLTITPRISLLPLQNKYFNMTLFVGAQIRAYATDRRDVNSGIRSTDGSLFPDAGGRVSTSVMRIFEPNFHQLKKIRHEIIPEVSYGIVPVRDLQRFPFYDHTDRPIHLNMLSLSITNLLNGKFTSGDTSEYRDISRMKLEARYSIAGEQRDLLTLVDQQQHHWSDLVLESDTWMSRLLRVTFNARYDMHSDSLVSAEPGIVYDDRHGNAFGVTYQMAHNEVEYLEGRISTKLIKPLNLSYTARYSFDRSDFLESVYMAEYRHKCWSVNLAAHQRPGNQSYTVNFNLAGLGSK